MREVTLIIVYMHAKERAVAPVAEWLRSLIFSALNPLSSHHLMAVGSSLAQVTSQVLLGGGQVFFLGDRLFLPRFTIDLAEK